MRKKMMQTGKVRPAGLVVALVVCIAQCHPVSAATFTFGSNANNLVGQSSVTLQSDGFLMQLTAGPTGAGLKETVSQSGLGVNSLSLPGVTVDATNEFGFIESSDMGTNGTAEFVQFSFDRPGFLTGFDFDGIKDERLEYFVLESVGGLRINFVDSRANMPDEAHPTFEHPLDQAIMDGAIVGDVVYLLEDSLLDLDDEVYGLQIPFPAGQIFTLTFGAAGLPYSQDMDFGGHLQGIEVGVPEPGTAWLMFAGWLSLGLSLWR